jgi:hypothetical protein
MIYIYIYIQDVTIRATINLAALVALAVVPIVFAAFCIYKRRRQQQQQHEHLSYEAHVAQPGLHMCMRLCACFFYYIYARTFIHNMDTSCIHVHA